MTTLLAQLSDPHLRVGPDDQGSARAVAAAVDRVLALEPAPDALLVSGDVAHTGAEPEYERARELLAPLAMSVLTLAGNHDRLAQRTDYDARCGELLVHAFVDGELVIHVQPV